MALLLERLFKLSHFGTTWRTEVLGGLATFLAMAYIIVVNPTILEVAGIPRDPSTVATILAAVFGCLLMGFYANRPIAVAPYMGENVFIAFGLIQMGIGFELRLGAVFVSGAAFLLLTLLGLRRWLVNAVSPSMKHSFGVGIGLFLLLIGLYQTGIVTSYVEGMPAAALVRDDKTLGRPPVPLKIGDFHDPRVQLALFGFVLTATLMAWRFRAAILLGIVTTGVVGVALGHGEAPEGVFEAPWGSRYSLEPIAGQLDILGVLKLSFLPVLLTLFLMSFLDTLGTLVAVGEAGGLLDERGNFPDIEKPMIVDAVSCMFSASIGTSTSGAFIESAVGIRQGARTGLAAVTTGLLFAVALFFLPLVQPLQALTFAYGPALLAVGVLMIGSIVKIDFNDMTETVPAIVTIVMMLFTYNIANGLTAGLALYPVYKVLCGRWRDVHPGAIVLAVMCLAYIVAGMPH